MKAAYQLDGAILVGELPDPVPAAGQVLVRTNACGMCASDVHLLKGGQNVVDASKEFGGPYSDLDLSRLFVPGHEYVGEILDYGPNSRRPLKVGTRVTSLPVIAAGSFGIIGQSNDFPGGFGELMLLDENFIMEIPSDLPDELAAMTEPLAVGLEHSRMGDPTKDDVCLVVGCGAIGLGVIAGLRMRGVGPIVAADFSPSRRALAIQMGADVALDPREVSPFEPLADLGGRVPSVIYENVGNPGMLGQIVKAAGFGAQIVVGGFCLEPEQLYVPQAQMKRLRIAFAAGEEQQDLDLALKSIADGTIDVGSWLGEGIGLGGVAAALTAMSDPSSPVRTVVDPRRA